MLSPLALGTLQKGTCLVCGLAHGKVRGIFDENNKPVKQAVPGMAVQVTGWKVS